MISVVIWLLLGTALALPDVRLAPSSSRVVEDYRTYKKNKGQYTSDLACAEFAEGLLMCFRYADGERLQYVLQSDVQRWETTTEQLIKETRLASIDQVHKDRFVFQDVENVTGGFWGSAQKDGWEAAGLLHPDRLEQMLGGKVLIAVPQSGTFLFWKDGNPQLNKAVAVGVKEVYNQASHPVSPFVYQWRQEKWVVWGQAVEKKQ